MGAWQLQRVLNKMDFLDPFQSDYRRSYGTETTQWTGHGIFLGSYRDWSWVAQSCTGSTPFSRARLNQY